MNKQNNLKIDNCKLTEKAIESYMDNDSRI